MSTKEVFEQCVRFTSELENKQSELDFAAQMNIPVEDEQLGLMVIQKLKQAIKLVEPLLMNIDKSRVLYHIALYANTIGKPSYGISLCYIVINEPDSPEKYRTMAKSLLNEIKLKLPADMYAEELQKTTLDIQAALNDAHQWLSTHERHASQPATKHVFNSDLIKKFQNKKARK